MESLLNFLAALVVMPLLGGTALCIVGAASQVALAATTPIWQKYLWFLGAGYVLLHWETLLAAVSSGAGQ